MSSRKHVAKSRALDVQSSTWHRHDCQELAVAAHATSCRVREIALLITPAWRRVHQGQTLASQAARRAERSA